MSRTQAEMAAGVAGTGASTRIRSANTLPFLVLTGAPFIPEPPISMPSIFIEGILSTASQPRLKMLKCGVPNRRRKANRVSGVPRPVREHDRDSFHPLLRDVCLKLQRQRQDQHPPADGWRPRLLGLPRSRQSLRPDRDDQDPSETDRLFGIRRGEEPRARPFESFDHLGHHRLERPVRSAELSYPLSVTSSVIPAPR